MNNIQCYMSERNHTSTAPILPPLNWSKHQSCGLCLVSCFDLWNPLEKRPILWNSSPRLYLEYPKPMYHDYGCDCVSPVAQPMELEKPRRLGVVPTVASVVLVVQGVSSDSPAFHLENATWAMLGNHWKLAIFLGEVAGLFQLELISCFSFWSVASSH